MSPNWLFRFWTIGLIASQRLWRIMDWSSKLWASGKHLSSDFMAAKHSETELIKECATQFSTSARLLKWRRHGRGRRRRGRMFATITGLMFTCATKQPYLKIMIIGWWWGPFHNLISYPPQTQMATACFRLKFLLRPPPSTPSLCPIKELICSSGDDCSMTLYTS